MLKLLCSNIYIGSVVYHKRIGFADVKLQVIVVASCVKTL